MKEFLNTLKPNNFVENYQVHVATPIYEYDTTMGYDNHLEETTKTLANDFVDNNYNWADYCVHFLKDDQQGGFYFGQFIGRRYLEKAESLESIIIDSIRCLYIIDKSHRNVNVIKGLLSVIEDKKERYNLLEIFLKEEQLNYLVLNIISGIHPTLKELKLLFSLVDIGKLRISNLSNLKYGRILDHLSSNEIIVLCNEINKYGLEGKWTSISILFMFCYKNEERFDECELIIKEILYTRELILYPVDNMEISYWKTFSQKFLEKKDVVFTKHLTKEIIRYAASRNVMNFDIEIQSLLRTLITNHFDLFWKNISNALLLEGAKFITYYKLRTLLGSRIGSPGNEIGLLFLGDLDEIFDWCKFNVPIAPKRIVSMAPIFEPKEGKRKCTVLHGNS